MLSERYRTHLTLTLTAHLQKGGLWFWYVTIPGFLAHNTDDRYSSKEQAIEAGLKLYPQAEVRNG